MARLGRQPPTAVQGNVFGGAGSLVGSFILAERCQVEDARCWSDGPLCNVQAVVNATHDRQPYHYPDTARSQVGQWVVLNARGNPFRNNGTAWSPCGAGTRLVPSRWLGVDFVGDRVAGGQNRREGRVTEQTLFGAWAR